MCALHAPSARAPLESPPDDVVELLVHPTRARPVGAVEPPAHQLHERARVDARGDGDRERRAVGARAEGADAALDQAGEEVVDGLAEPRARERALEGVVLRGSLFVIAPLHPQTLLTRPSAARTLR